MIAIYRELWTIVKVHASIGQGMVVHMKGPERGLWLKVISHHDAIFVEHDLNGSDIDPREFRYDKLVWK